jgi:hypothetical protein
MVAAARLKPDPPQTENYPALNAKRNLLARREALSIGLALARNQRDAESDRTAAARHIAGDCYPLARRRPDKVAAELREIDDELELLEPDLRRERELYEADRQRRANLKAIALQPRHRAAVVKIGKALELLSMALQEESDVRSEFAAGMSNDLAMNPHLLDASTELAAVGSLADWNSGASQWARRMQKIGIL